MNLNRQQLSFLITLFSMGIVVLVLYNIHLGAQADEEDDYVVEMVLEEPEELTEEEEKILEELAKTEAIKSHMAFNETAKPSYGSPEPLQTLEEIMEERAMEDNGEIAENLLSDADFVQRVKKLAQKGRKRNKC